MNSKRFFVALTGCVALGCATLWAADVNLTDVKCVVAPRPASQDKSADYKEGKVYFCCGNCQGKFKAEPAKFATKANHQLVATHQYEQKSCPLSGNPVNAEQTVKVEGTEVGFCCGNCKGAVAKAEGEKQLEMVFGDKAFEKGFGKVAAKK